jgi:glucose-1-phosphate adenylyltransferase
VVGGAVRDALVAEGTYLEECTIESSVVGIRSRIGPGSRVTRSVLLGADYYEDTIGVGRDVVIDRAIVDKNARIGDGCRLVNARGLEEADGEGWCVRSGIIVIPKGASVPAGTEV